MEHSLEYFSLHYLNMWLKNDQRWHETLKIGSLDAKLISIKEAATSYKVARNLLKKCDEGAGCKRYYPIAKILDNVKDISTNSSTNTVVKSIEKVATEISEAYYDRNVLSFTTKLLWLKMRSPIIIYDSQARKALKTKDGNYQDFYEAWRDEYSKYDTKIAKVCTKLKNVSKYSYCHTLVSPSYVQDISSQPWFQERVFDVYLWHKGQSKS